MRNLFKKKDSSTKTTPTAPTTSTTPKKVAAPKATTPKEATPKEATPRKTKSAARQETLKTDDLPVPAFVPTGAYAGVPQPEATAPEGSDAPEPIVDSRCIPDDAAVTSSQPAMMPHNSKENLVNLTLKSLDKRGRNAIYTGAAVSLRFPIGAFPDKTPPATLSIDGLAEKTERVPRAKLTKEERAALPKPTLAERVARAEKRAADLKAKLAKDAGQPVAQPSF